MREARLPPVVALARVTKTILEPGNWRSPQGELRATPERIRRYADQFAAMKAKGIRVPLPWGHQPHALPITPDEIAESEYARSRFNAGYVEDLFVSKAGKLRAVIDAPGLDADADGNLVDPRNGTAIAEVSPGIAGKWTDGHGQTWEDAILHVALTPLPVQTGQDGFTPLSTPAPAVQWLSLGTMTLATEGGPAVADETEIPEGDDAGEGEGSGGGVTVADLLGPLGEHGIVLPEDTDDANFMDRLLTAITALKGQLTPADDDAPADDAGAADGTPATPEAPPVMLSTKSIADPVLRGVAERETEEADNRRLARINLLARRNVPGHLVEKLRKAARAQPAYLLSTTGRVAHTALDAQLDALEEALPADGRLLSTSHHWLAAGHAVPLPETERGMDEKKAAKVLDEQHGARARA